MVSLDQVLTRRVVHRKTDGLSMRIIRSEKAAATLAEVSWSTSTSDLILLTADDIPGENILEADGVSMPLLAADDVRYIGQPVALVAGPDHLVVDRAALDVAIDYGRVHPKFEIEGFTPDQVVKQRELSWGDPDSALADAFQVVEGRYRTGIFEELAGLPAMASTEIDESGRLIVRCATRWPHHAHRTVCRAVGFRPSRCKVITTMVGVPVPRGIWEPSAVAALAAVATVVTGRPVTVEIPPDEAFRYSSKPPICLFRHTTGLDEEGDPVVVDVEVLVGLGAYPLYADEIVDRILASSIGGYRSPHVRVRVVGLVTNVPPTHLAEGVGTAQALFAGEMHASRIVEIAQLDPVAFRKRNLSENGRRILRPDTGRGESNIVSILDTVNRQSDFSRKHAAFELQKKRREAFTSSLEQTRGIGISIVGVGAGLTGLRENALKATVSVRLEKEGSATLLTSAVPENLRMIDTWRRIVAETLDVDPESVSVPEPDTDICPDSGPSILSRNTASVTRLIENCCSAIQKQRFRSPLPIEVKRSYRGPRGVGWSEGSYEGDPFGVVSWGACVVEVEADPVTLGTSVRDVWLVLDAGALIDEQHARESIELGILRSLFWAGGSHVEYRKGRIPQADYLGARTPEIGSTPRISIQFVGGGSRTPHKGVGEVPPACVPAAYVQAVSQATGQYLDRLPSTPRTVFSYLEEE